MPDIRTRTDLIETITRCLKGGDEMLLDHAQATVEGWLIPENERDAYSDLIDAVRDAILR